LQWQWDWLGVHVVPTTVTAMITTVVTITNTVTVITMTANTVDREGLQMKTVKNPAHRTGLSSS
jgi:hypothetical protein